MRIATFAAVTALTVAGILAATSAAQAQSDAATPHKRIFGYQDAVDGTFHSLAKAVPDATTTPTTGTVELTLTITIKSTFPTGTTRTILCSSNLDESTLVATTDAITVHTEAAYSYATVSGTTATCTVNIPYSWLLPAASATNVTSFDGSYTIEVINSTTTAGPPVLRLSGADFLTLTAVPATGTITKVAVSATI